MRTMLIILGGFALLALALLLGRWLGGGSHGMVAASKIFIPVWLAVALVNMWIGVSRAGYSVRDELPIAIVIFALPAAAAIVIWRRMG
jgi:hypothetical protein